MAAGVGLLTLSALLAFRELGIWWSDALVWPLVLAAFGAALLWGRSATPARRRCRPTGRRPAPNRRGPARRHGRAARGSQLADLYRGVFGVLLVIGAALLFLSSNHILGGLRDAALTAVVVVVALGLILAPFLWRLGRNLAAERAERIRSQERAEVAAHLHDSVLQTLTLMQKRADDPREVAALARRQERELRDWLAGGDRERQRRAELRRGAPLGCRGGRGRPPRRDRVVVVGDCELDERAEAVLGAAREALLNAAKHAAEPGRSASTPRSTTRSIEVFVRDRGPGFDLGAVPGPSRRARVDHRQDGAGRRARRDPLEPRRGHRGGIEIAPQRRRARRERR